MKAAPIARISLGLIGIGIVLAITNSLVNSVALSNKLYLVATVQLAVALVFAVRVNKPNRAVWPVLLLIVLCSSVAQIFDGTFTAQPSMQAIPESLFLAVQLLLAGGLLYIVSSRLGSDPLSVLADGLIVALGAWFFIWTVLLQPTIGTQSITPLIAAIQGSTLGISAIVLFTLATCYLETQLAAHPSGSWLARSPARCSEISCMQQTMLAVSTSRRHIHPLHIFWAYFLHLQRSFIRPSLRSPNAGQSWPSVHSWAD